MRPRIVFEKRLAAASFLVWSLGFGPGCGPSGAGGVGPGADAGVDAGLDGGSDAGPDAGSDAGSDAGPDAGMTSSGMGDGGTLRVLFIGDSYTYVNDLPGMLADLASSSGVAPAINVGQVVQGGATLGILWDEGGAQQAILDGGWTHVVLQDQSLDPLSTFAGTLVAFSEGSNFAEYAQQFGALVTYAGAIPTWFVTWARAAGSDLYPGDLDTPAEMQDELTAAYDSAASAFPQSVLACAGPAFQLAIAQHPEIALQQSDDSHPTVAGTYLAACTFYVALTGNPVPATSAVPQGLSAATAAVLRSIAQIGSNCADVQIKGITTLTDRHGAADFSGGIDAGPFDYGVAGTSVANPFYLTNLSPTAIGLGGATLAPPFAWTNGVYPGGSGFSDTEFLAPSEVPYCGDVLPPYSSCALSVSFTGASTNPLGALSVGLTDAYVPNAGRLLTGTATDRAMLEVTDAPDFSQCDEFADLPNCEAVPGTILSDAGESVTAHLLVGNRGGASTTAIEAAPLTAPFGWDADGGFPGGAGTDLVDGGLFPYCTQTLNPGDFCAIAVRFAPTDGGSYLSLISLSYDDSQGAVSMPGLWELFGTAPYDAGPIRPPP